MVRTRSIIVSTPLFTGILLFLFLALLPSLSVFIGLNKNYEKMKTYLVNGYENYGIPDINYNNNEIRSNNDMLFQKEFTSQQQGKFHFAIDTSEIPNNETIEWCKKGDGAVALLRKEIFFYASKQKNEKIIPYEDIPLKLNITFNADFINNMLSKFKNTFIFITISLKFAVHLFGKFILWGIVALIYSGKAKITGGGNYSLALWSLLPPTLFQFIMSLLPLFTGMACCSFIIYYIIWVVSFMNFEKKLIPKNIEE